MAFLLHDLYHLRPDGIMAIVMPHGVLFRGKTGDRSEGDIRKTLVERNHLDAIVGLPPNIFFGTGIPTIVAFLRKTRERSGILIVDASKGFVKDGNKNRLRSSDVKRIVDTVTGHLDVPGYSRNVPLDEIRENGYNLNIPRYVRNRETEQWDIRAIMEGGIPERELDGLAPYWQVFGGAREALFEVDGHYARVKAGDVGAELAGMASVKEYVASMEKALDGFDSYLKTELLDGWKTVAVNAEEGKITDELFRRVEEIPLIDKYDAYQLLDDEWTQTALDLEIMQMEGFDAVRGVEPHIVLKKHGEETVEEKDGWMGRILPFDLVQRELFAPELEAIGALSREAERLEGELEALAGEMSEDDRDGVMEEGETELDAKLVATKADEVLADIDTPELSALSAYLELAGAAEKRLYTATHPEVDWSAMEASRTGLYGKKTVESRMRAIREEHEFPEDSFERLVVRADQAFRRIKALKSDKKTLENQLETKTIDRIQHLTDEEAMQLLEAKWVRPLAEKLAAMPRGVVGKLTDKVKALAEKYGTTLSQISARIKKAEKELEQLLGELEGGPNDMAGIAAWREKLTENSGLCKMAMLLKMFPQGKEKVPEVRFKGFEGEWETTDLSDMVYFSKGKGYSKSDIAESGVPLFLYGQMYTNYQVEVSSVQTFAKLQPGALLSKGREVVVPASGETPEDIARASAIASSGIILGGDLNVLTPKNDDILPQFLALSLSTGETAWQISERAQGKTVVHIHNSDLQELTIAKPSLPEQRKIGSFFRSLDELLAARREEVEKLKQMKQALLERMFA